MWPVAVDHHIDRIAGFYRDRAIRLAQFINGHQAFELITEVDQHFRGSDFYYVALEQLAFRGRCEMAVILDEMLEIVFWGIFVLFTMGVDCIAPARAGFRVDVRAISPIHHGSAVADIA